MVVIVKLFGSLEKLAERKIIEINIEGNNNIEVKTVLKRLIEIVNKEEFKNILETSGNYVVFINGVEISALNGLNSLVKDESEVVIVPVVHGG